VHRAPSKKDLGEWFSKNGGDSKEEKQVFHAGPRTAEVAAHRRRKVRIVRTDVKHRRA
jgi:hypothetical protein